MNEKIKIKEAKYFLLRMKAVESNYEEFTYNLSAFLTSTRTVMQYCCEEATNNGQRPWYDSAMDSSDVLKFFKMTRDLVIHVVPCKLQKNVEVQVPTLTTQASLQPVAISSSGNLVIGTPIQVPATQSAQAITIHTYKFDTDWYDVITAQYNANDKAFCQGLCQSYDVMTFCQKYVDELDRVVTDGINKGYITG